MELISKIQYKDSEKGEFHNISGRSLPDTKALIKTYPWSTERHLAPVELTCPSVTIEHPAGTCLKVGHYFSSKFCLYFLDANNSVYFHVADTLDDVCSWVRKYFDQEGILQGLQKYSLTMNPAAHFRTNTFEYSVTTKRKRKFFALPLIMTHILLGLLILALLQDQPAKNLLAAAMVLLFTALLWAPLLYLYFDYVAVDRHQYLKISRGHDEFVFGTSDKRKTYRKQDISSVESYRTSATRSPWNACRVYIIRLKDGEELLFTSLLISEETLMQKLPRHPAKVITRYFPIVPNS